MRFLSALGSRETSREGQQQEVGKSSNHELLKLGPSWHLVNEREEIPNWQCLAN